MRRQRHRTASENILGIESTSNRVITSSWETPKKHFGHVRVSPAPNRQCEGMPGPAEMQTFHVSVVDRTDHLSNQVNQQNKTFQTVQDFINYFCEDKCKSRNIRKILVATNGIAAIKCILSIRKNLMQLFKDDRIIKFVCLTTEQEIQSKAEYLKMADDIVTSPAGANTNNYANVDEIVHHAIEQKVDAVWAGWGHASENPKLPTQLSKHGIVFIGPPASAMFALGDKIASTIIAQSVGIPTIEWSGSGIKAPDLDFASGTQDVELPQDIYLQATVSSAAEGLRCLKEKNISYPIMIKASEGGGGKGIRKCLDDASFEDLYRRVATEVPGSPIFLMKCMENARHIEVQLIADTHGDVIPVFTRDCSIQRRCQKIIEEAPASIAPKHVLRAMQQDAVNLAKKVGYVSAGTVEYMYVPATQKYYFLELNPRLQVEHPCTEMVSDINIPAVQLQIAMGLPLHRIVDIRRFYSLDRYGTSPLPEDQIRTDTDLFVIAARITSEDPAEGFRPASGSVQVVNFQSNQNVWGYFSVAGAGKVHEFADSQFGHLFAKGTTRHEAVSALYCALRELELRATFQSQVNYLVGMLRDPEFEQNTFHTGWLDARIQASIQCAPEHPKHVTLAVGATVIGHARMEDVFGKFTDAIARGQILPAKELKETWELELVYQKEKYTVLVNRYGPTAFLVKLNDQLVHTLVRMSGNDLLVSYAGQTFRCFLEEEMERFKVYIGNTMATFEKENDPSLLRSRNAGRLLQYLKKDGDTVAVGDIYAEMESMKMVITLNVKAAGTLVQVARPGQVVFPGTLIARIETQSSKHDTPSAFLGEIDEWSQIGKSETTAEVRLNTQFEQILQACKDVLAGYTVPEHLLNSHIASLTDDLFRLLDHPQLPTALYQSVYHVVRNKISPSTQEQIESLLRKPHFNAAELTECLDAFLQSLNPQEVGVERQHFELLNNVCLRFVHGLEGHKRFVVRQLLDLLLETERYFQDVSYDKGVADLRLLTETLEVSQVVRMIYSHTRIAAKNALLMGVMRRLLPADILELQTELKKVANLFNPENEPLALCVRNALNRVAAHHANDGTNTLDAETLELHRVPTDAVNVSDGHAPFTVFKLDDAGIMRFFVRHVVRDSGPVVSKYSKALPPLERLKSRLTDAIDGICGEVRQLMQGGARFDNHVLVYLDNDNIKKVEEWSRTIKDVLRQHEPSLIKLSVTQVEVLFKVNNEDKVESMRVIYTNETGAIPEYSVCKVLENRLHVLEGSSRHQNVDVLAAQPRLQHVQRQLRRLQAQRLRTTYCYDLPAVFARAVLELWYQFRQQNPHSFAALPLTPELKQGLTNHDATFFCTAHELVLRQEDGPIEVIRDQQELEHRAHSASHDRGMVAWEISIVTPDCLTGRTLVLIANDITFQSGSFSMREHRLYYHASRYSRFLGVPRVYVAANSGARIGFAADVKRHLDVIWNDATKPEDGVQALSLDTEDPAVLDQVMYTRNKKGKLELQAIVGKENDIGVENLVGSGLIAGETSAAYQEVPTYCLVTGRAVGIGAYAARLSHRIVQVEPSHLILTGAPALNSLLGREIYTSNGQLGGTQVMYNNGVSHAIANSDLEGMIKIVHWISYLPVMKAKYVEERLDESGRGDDLERPVRTEVPNGQYDPRSILDPVDGGGLFDAHSFDEIMAGWAKSIITGRARLCGVSVGVIAVETRTITCEIPADPAASDSQSKQVVQAGQVWYPDSAYKTADAINDFNREGLPLVFLANIRGFSGGQKDMFEMVLKFGAGIVDALQAYTQPVIVYIPPHGELRGGAWAVLDTQINPTCITMLADGEARGGVLEPDGIVEIKFRARDLYVQMEKSDAQMRSLVAALSATPKQETTKVADLEAKIKSRREVLAPVFRTMAVQFADLHDTPYRLLAKDAIHDQVSWKNVRNYMYRLLCVKKTRLQMARRYLQAKTGQPGPFDVQQLTEGCQWLDSHLTEQQVSVRDTLDPESGDANRSKFRYTADCLAAYARGNEFSRVLADIDMKRCLSMLNRMNVNTDDEARATFVQDILNGAASRPALVHRVLPTLTDAEREAVAQQLLQSLSAEQRHRVQAGLP